MTLLYIFLFVFLSQDCSQLGECLEKSDTTFFTPYLFKYIGEEGGSNFAEILPHVIAFDFKKVSNPSNHDYEGFVIWDNGRCDFLQRSVAPNHNKSLCKCTKQLVCENCRLFQRKIRNGVFYGGHRRVYRQDQDRSVFVSEYSLQGEKLTERLLFTNFKIIIQVNMREDNSVVFATWGTSEDLQLVYNYDNDSKSMNQRDFPGFQAMYENKFPWKRTYLTKDEKQDKKLDVLGCNLIMDNVHIPLWVSAFKKIQMSQIIFIDKKNDLVLLQSNEPLVYAFQSKTGQFFEVDTTKTPQYSEDDFSWVYQNIDLLTILQPIKQSLLGYYFEYLRTNFKSIGCLAAVSILMIIALKYRLDKVLLGNR